jgi:large repetitive protein
VQGGLPVATVTQDGGLAQARVSASDPNPADTVTPAWFSLLLDRRPQDDSGPETFTFNPAVTATGAHWLRGEARDDGTPVQETRREQLVRVIETAPAFSDGVDSDGDGFADTDEGLLDLNGNGVSDWLDPSTFRHQVPARTGGSGLLQVAAGYQLSLGISAMATGEDALVSIMDIAEYANLGRPVDNAGDPLHSYPGGVFDVTVSGLAELGEDVVLVLPQMAPVPDRAGLRVYSVAGGWEDANLVGLNDVFSAPGAPGACPAPESPLYTPGLTAGDHCVQVRLQDNGGNDGTLIARSFTFTGGVTSARTATAIAASAITLPDAGTAVSDRGVPLLAFRLDSNSSDVRLDGLTLAASGSGDDANDIQKVRVWWDLNANGQLDGADGEYGTGTFASDDGTLEIRFTTPFRLDTGGTNFIVSYDFQETGND